MKVRHFFKILLIWFVLFIIVCFIFAAIPGTSEMVDTTSSYSSEYKTESKEEWQGNGNQIITDSESEGIGQDRSSHEGRNQSDNSKSEAKMFTETYIEEQMKGIYFVISALIAAVMTLGILILTDANQAQRLKASVSSLRLDVVALEERREHQLNQANRVLDKYLSHENAIHQEAYKSRVRGALEFEAVLEQYPEIKANIAVEMLLQQIKEIETSLIKQKQDLNKTIAKYNGLIHTFPVLMVRKKQKLEDIVIEAPVSVAYMNEVSDKMLGI